MRVTGQSHSPRRSTRTAPSRRGEVRAQAAHAVQLQRVYDPGGAGGGTRFLVERLWPRGMRKEALRAAWLKEVGPSTALRKWFGHDPARWAEFRRRYFAELDAAPQTWTPIAEAARRGPVTLLYSSHDTEHNNAVALKEYLVRPHEGRDAIQNRRLAS